MLVVYTLAVAEVFVRIVKPQPHMPRYVTGMPWGVRGNIPNSDYRHHTMDVDVGFHINAQGMRADHDIVEAKPQGVCRIALFGDSFFMGYELNLQDTLAFRLERSLKQSGANIEVLNFAVSGFGTAESLRTYQSYAEKFSPDIVLLEWDRSDFDDNIRSGLYRLEGNTLVATGQSYLPSVKLQNSLMAIPVYRWLADYSDLYSLMREVLSLKARNLTAQISSELTKMQQRFRHGAAPAPRNASQQEVTPPWAGDISSSMIELSSALIDHFSQLVRSQKQSFYLVEIPFQYPSQHAVSTLSLYPEARRAQWPVISAVEAFNHASKDHLLFYEHGDGHITPYAAGLILAPLVERLKSDAHLASCRE